MFLICIFYVLSVTSIESVRGDQVVEGKELRKWHLIFFSFLGLSFDACFLWVSLTTIPFVIYLKFMLLSTVRDLLNQKTFVFLYIHCLLACLRNLRGNEIMSVLCGNDGETH